ncbi:MAG: guanylate kinase [Desulfobacterales bacterium]|nr:guanylate kinase [Desulfobacterales bacterium]
MKRKKMAENRKAKSREQSHKGRLFIVSAPSGAGKSTLCQAAREQFSDLIYSISFTTRAPRTSEKHGVDYFFISKAEFEKRIQQGDWAEWANVHGHYYGTSASFLSQQLSSGRRVLLDIDVQGARQILKQFPDSVTIFIMPPALEVLRERLEKRGGDDPETIKKRLNAAKAEIAQKDLYQHVIVNDQLDKAVAAFCDIISRYPPRS